MAKDEPLYLNEEERAFLLQILETVQLSGDAAALRRALVVFEAIHRKLSNGGGTTLEEGPAADGGR